MYLILTFDVESCLGEDEITRDLPHTLDILSSYPHIKCTFNVAAHSVEIDRKSVRRILDEGHEVAAHGYRHDMNWDVKGKEEQEELILRAKGLLESELDTKVVGWATPRGNKYSADVELLKKCGFLYVRDRSYRNYYQFIPPQVSDGFVNLPRFGYDETGFISWNSEQIHRYLENMFNYKRNIERTYLVTNLHPVHIYRNREVQRAFINFLQGVSKCDGVALIRAGDFAEALVNGNIRLNAQNTNIPSTSKDESITVVQRKLPDLTLVFNSCHAGYTGSLTLDIGVFKALMLSVLKYTGRYNLVYDWSKTIPPYQISLRHRTIELELELPPYSTSRFYIGRVKQAR